MAASSSVDEVSSLSSSKYLSQLVWMGLVFYGIYFSAVTAYNFRMGPIDKFGTIIHEFDPYFNLRATEVSQTWIDTIALMIDVFIILHRLVKITHFLYSQLIDIQCS